MHPAAVVHAQRKLENAERALHNLRNAEDFSEIEREWSAFLMALGTIYTKLEQGSKLNNVSRGWFDQVKRERREDKLLQYLHQARNAEEHGIEDITSRNARILRQPLKLPNGKTAELRISLPAGPEDLQLSEDGNETKLFDGLQRISSTVALVPVKNHGTIFSVPDEHLGKPFAPVDPLAVAEAGYDYAALLVSTAKAFSELN
ncbi:hypothetical protein [uncultured Sphingomonas sp.]|uniref:hypothetical protein n=1 Tax=uncultured Sphingomonas sp. TaxID=158754 RepID=UPI0025DB27D3|nr:hypothetical protein [uncultured Sphingomonas sp.]